MAVDGAVAWGFPGQGVQWESVVERLDASSSPLVTALAERTGTRDWASVDPADTRRAQGAILTAGLVAAADLDRQGLVVVCGHSFGELTALVAAEVLRAEDALDLALLRGELGAEVQAATGGSMLAVVSVDEWEVERLRRQAVAATGGPCELAVRNHALQVVLSGAPGTLAWIEERVPALGGRAHVLAIGGPFHTPAMGGAAERYVAAVAASPLSPPTVPVVLSTSPHPLVTAADLDGLPARLGDGLVMPVDWPRALGLARELGAERGLDVGPGNVLGKIGRRAGLRFATLWDPLPEDQAR